MKTRLPNSKRRPHTLLQVILRTMRIQIQDILAVSSTPLTTTELRRPLVWRTLGGTRPRLWNSRTRSETRGGRDRSSTIRPTLTRRRNTHRVTYARRMHHIPLRLHQTTRSTNPSIPLPTKQGIVPRVGLSPQMRTSIRIIPTITITSPQCLTLPKGAQRQALESLRNFPMHVPLCHLWIMNRQPRTQSQQSRRSASVRMHAS